jgi:predicted oxidoreductase
MRQSNYHGSMTSHTLPHLSPVIAGCWRLAAWQQSTQERLAWIEACLELGITSFDHADIYGGYEVQALFGKALALKPGLRQQLQLISKAGICPVTDRFPARTVKHYDSSAAHLISSTEQSLRELRTDYLDVLLIHRPDPLADWDEIARAFEQLRASGKVRAFGVSNFNVAQFQALHRRTPLITNQIELSALHTDALHEGTLLQAQELNVRPMIWSPLAGGKLFKPDTEQASRVQLALQAISDELNVSAPTVAYAWVLRHPSRPLLITGTHRKEAMAEAVRATDITLSREQWTRIWQASMGHAVP